MKFFSPISLSIGEFWSISFRHYILYSFNFSFSYTYVYENDNYTNYSGFSKYKLPKVIWMREYFKKITVGNDLAMLGTPENAFIGVAMKDITLGQSLLFQYNFMTL